MVCERGGLVCVGGEGGEDGPGREGVELACPQVGGKRVHGWGDGQEQRGGGCLF